MDDDFPVLVVDDDAVSRSIIRKYLHSAGFEVVSARDAMEALVLFDQRFCPIVLTDWMMPGISGPELCRKIREKKTDSYVFIVLITARDSKNDIVSGLEAGADDYLTKPIHQAELVARIKTGIRILRLEKSLKNANDEIRVLSITDSLTGCFNRTYLGEQFPQELSRCKRYNHSLSVVLADIDHFKRVNDTYGHQIGDLVLKSFAECVMEQIRENIDWVVRFGGEEFLIVLPETGCSGAETAAERLRKRLKSLRIPCDGKHLSITASFGGACACFTTHSTLDISMEQLIDKADEQLYLSKRQGRDRINLIQVI
jgi:two-component system, cell cycle response regulator